MDRVARERQYLALLEAPSVESTREFVRKIVEGGAVQTLAVTPDDAVVGRLDGRYDDNVVMALLDGDRPAT